MHWGQYQVSNQERKKNEKPVIRAKERKPVEKKAFQKHEMTWEALLFLKNINFKMIYTGSHRKKVKNLRKFHCILFTVENINKLGGRRKKSERNWKGRNSLWIWQRRRRVLFLSRISFVLCITTVKTNVEEFSNYYV